MRILLVVHQFLPDFCSGTEVLTWHSAQALRELGHEVRLFTAMPTAAALDDAQRFDAYVFEGIAVSRFRHGHRAMGGQDNVLELEYDNHLVARHFAALVDDFKPEVVHFFHLMRLSASIVDVCTARGIAMVLTPTDFWFVCPTCQLRLEDGAACAGPDPVAANCVRHLAALKAPPAIGAVLRLLPLGALTAMVKLAAQAPLSHFKAARMVTALSRRRAFLRQRLNRIDRVLVPTRVMRDTLLGLGLDPERTRSCAYGIRLPPPAASPRRERGPLVIGVIGLGEHKGAQVVIQALGKLPEVGLRLKIYGRETDFPHHFERLRRMAAKDARVAFCGGFANENIGSVLADLDILAVPSIWAENAPLVVYSAQAAARPVLASDVAGIAELVRHGDNGWLFPAGDADALARIIAELAADRTKIDNVAARARPPKSIEAYAAELLDSYRELAANRRSAT